MLKPKKIDRENAKLTGRTPEFALISKGIGKSYLTPQMVDWHKKQTATRVYVTSDGNKKTGLPRYFKDKIYNTEDKRKINIARLDREHKKAKQVTDVFTHQHNLNESKKSLYRKMSLKDQKKLL